MIGNISLPGLSLRYAPASGKGALLAVALFFYSTFYAMPGQAKQCARLGPPDITVAVAEAPARFDMGATKEDITAMARNGRKAEVSSRYHSPVSGLSAGVIKLGHKISYSQQTDPKTGLGCLWVDKVSVTLWVEPKIFIADELQNKACWFGSVFAHEARHVAEDRALVAKYKPLIAGGLRLLFAGSDDYVIGPFLESHRPAHVKYVEQSTRAALGVLFQAMMDEQAARHQHIDTPAEYQAASRKCRL